MYWKDTYTFLNSIEYEFKYPGNYGAKGEKRKPKEKATPEQIKKQNLLNKIASTRRLIKANFLPGDLFVSLNYPAGTRKTLDQIKKDMEKFLNRLKYRYHRQQEQAKFIYRIEKGRRGGIHIHMIINRANGKKGTDQIIRESWKEGRAHFTTLYEEGGYEQLAVYITKPPPEGMEDDPEAQECCRIHTSRNLIRPKPERKKYRRWTLRKLIEKVDQQDYSFATPGYHIDPDTVSVGINKYTGMSYLKYTEVRDRLKERWDE